MQKLGARCFLTETLRQGTVISNNVWGNFGQAVGNTPLIRLNSVSEKTGCNIYGKAEFMNPGGSVKDRAALWIIKDAEEQGLLSPETGGVVLESTAGNTGIGLSHVANSRGYKTIILIPSSQSQEKKDTLRQLGAQLIEVPPVPFKNPNNYVHVASRLLEKLKAKGVNVLYANQWDNKANRRAHIESTGPEIWAQTEGKIDAFSCAMGTGGTLTGVAEFLRSKKKNIKIGLTDPCGAALVHYYQHNELKSNGSSISEGIGQGRVTGNMEGFRPDICEEVPDSEGLLVLYEMMEKEGLMLGTSSAINVAGAVRMAERLGPGHTIVTILCDSANRYSGKLYNPQFLRGAGLPVLPWLDEPDAEKTKQIAEMEVMVKDSYVEV